MPNDFADLEREANLLIGPALGQMSRSFLDIVDVIYVGDGAEDYVERTPIGSRSWTAQLDETPPSADPIKSGKSTTTPAPYRKLEKFDEGAVLRNPNLVLDSVQRFVDGFLDLIEDSWWTAVCFADTFAHPLNGKAELSATGGGTAYFADAFTVLPLKGTSFTQANLVADSLSAANLSAGREIRAGWRTLGGDRKGGSTDNPWLFGVSQVFPLAQSLAARGSEIYDGTGLQLGGFTDMRPVRVPAGVTTSTNLWGLLWSRPRTINGVATLTAPVMPVVRTGLNIRVSQPSDDTVVHVLGRGEVAIHFMATEEADLQLHKS